MNPAFSSVISFATRMSGRSPQTTPSFKLLTIPAWQAANRDLFFQLVIWKTRPKLMSVCSLSGFPAWLRRCSFGVAIAG